MSVSTVLTSLLPKSTEMTGDHAMNAKPRLPLTTTSSRKHASLCSIGILMTNEKTSSITFT